jgi:hypothetical protein
MTPTARRVSTHGMAVDPPRAGSTAKPERDQTAERGQHEEVEKRYERTPGPSTKSFPTASRSIAGTSTHRPSAGGVANKADWFGRRWITGTKQGFVAETIVTRDHVLLFDHSRDEAEVVINPRTFQRTTQVRTVPAVRSKVIHRQMALLVRVPSWIVSEATQTKPH